jgi:hypothetical protein
MLPHEDDVTPFYGTLVGAHGFMFIFIYLDTILLRIFVALLYVDKNLVVP